MSLHNYEESVLQENIIILNLYKANNTLSKYEAKLIKLQCEIVNSTIKIGTLNMPLSKIDRCSWQKISKDIFDLKGDTNQLDLVNWHLLNTSGAAD